MLQKWSICLFFILVLNVTSGWSQFRDSLTGKLIYFNTQQIEELISLAKDSSLINPMFASSRLELAKVVARELDLPKQMLRIVANELSLFQRNKDKRQQIELIKQGLNAYKQLSDIEQLELIRPVYVLFNVAIRLNYDEKTELSDDFGFIKEMLDLYRRLPKTDDTLFYAVSIGEAFFLQLKFDEAERFVKPVFEVISNRPYQQNSIDVTILLSSIYLHQGKIEDAMLVLNMVLKSFADDLSDVDKNFLYGNLATIYLDQQEWEKAKEIFLNLFELNRQAEKKHMELQTAYRLLLISENQQNVSEIEAWAKHVYLLATELYESTLSLRALTYLILVHEKKGEYKQALNYSLKRQFISDSLKNLEIKRELALIQSDLDLARSERELALTAERERKTKQVNVLIGFVSFLLLVMIIWMWRWNKRVRQLNHLLAHQNELISNQKEHLEQVIQTKNQLFSIIGHDIRGPMSNMIMFMDVLLEENKHEASFKQHVKERLLGSAETTMTLLDNLVYWGMSELNQLEIVPEKVRLDELMSEVLQPLQTHLEIKKIALKINGENETYVQTDPRILSLLLRNILSNAIKFTPAFGEIRISHHVVGETFSVCVCDSGVGMSPNKVQELETGNAKSEKGTHQEKGSGLGMKLLKSFSEKISATYTISSELNKGTCIAIRAQFLS